MEVITREMKPVEIRDKVVYKRNGEVLKNTAARILEILSETTNRFVSNEVMVERLWDVPLDKYSLKRLKVHTSHLREFLEFSDTPFEVYSVLGDRGISKGMMLFLKN